MGKLQLISAGTVKPCARPDLGLSSEDIQMLKDFDPEDRLAAFAFVEFSRGQKFQGGIQAKLACKQGFIEGFRICKKILHAGPDLERELKEL